MSGAVPLLPKFQFSNNGAPMVNGTVTVYLAGTVTPSNTWQDEALTILNTNPIVLDARGDAVIYLDPALSYKFLLKNAGGVTQWTQDDVKGGATAFEVAAALAAAAAAHAAADGLRTDLAAKTLAKGSDLIGFDATLNYAAGTIGVVLHDICINPKMFPWLAPWDGVSDDSAAVQAAVNYIGTKGGGTLLWPEGGGKLDTPITVCDYLTIQGNGPASTGLAHRGSYVIVNNATAGFTAPYIRKLQFRDVGFVATGAGIGAAYAYKQTNLAFYSERCLFQSLDVWANMGGGFYGNFILTTWRRCEMGYFGTVGAQFLPIYSMGAIASLQTNANIIEDCYILNSKGAYTVFFEAGTDLTLRNAKFEQNNADSTLHCKGIMVVNMEGVYIEASNGAATLYPIIFENDTTNAQGCSVINVRGNAISMSANNTHLIRHLGASGPINFVGNRVDGMTGKNMTSSVSGTNKGFGQYQDNTTPGFTGCSNNITTPNGSWTPTIKASTGGSAHTYGIQQGRFTRVGKQVIAHFRVTITAKDGTSGGSATIGLTGLPAPDTPPSGGFTGALQYTAGITYPASCTAIVIGIESTTEAVLLGTGSGSVAAAVPMSGLAASTSIIGVLMYETSDA